MNTHDVTTGRILTMLGSFALGLTFKEMLDENTTEAICGAITTLVCYKFGFKMLKSGVNGQ
ncbi:hypothetical protein ER45_030440 (plasmid) [Bacillus mycoides]|nr:hypothetical protein ER45_030440 [Bacillus mycoides]